MTRHDAVASYASYDGRLFLVSAEANRSLRDHPTVCPRFICSNSTVRLMSLSLHRRLESVAPSSTGTRFSSSSDTPTRTSTIVNEGEFGPFLRRFECVRSHGVPVALVGECTMPVV